MDSRITQLRRKDLIDVHSGSRYGCVGDLEIDLETGQVQALVVPGRLRLLGLLGRERERVFPWTAVRCFGEDTILVDGSQEDPSSTRRRK
jgi:YlmC/YmxH family sporulation protein